jgi:hypothetical protein
MVGAAAITVIVAPQVRHVIDVGAVEGATSAVCTLMALPFAQHCVGMIAADTSIGPVRKLDFGAVAGGQCRVSDIGNVKSTTLDRDDRAPTNKYASVSN